MPQMPTPVSILALAPGTRHFGFAVLRDGELVAFGVKCLPPSLQMGALQSRVRKIVGTLRRRHQPAALAIEEPFYVQALTSRVPALVRMLRTWARGRGLRVTGITPDSVKERFCKDRKTRAKLVGAMVDRYWFLARYADEDRLGEYWQQMFDAVALGTFAFETRKQTPVRSLKQLHA